MRSRFKRSFVKLFFGWLSDAMKNCIVADIAIRTGDVRMEHLLWAYEANKLCKIYLYAQSLHWCCEMWLKDATYFSKTMPKVILYSFNGLTFGCVAYSSISIAHALAEWLKACNHTVAFQHWYRHEIKCWNFWSSQIGACKETICTSYRNWFLLFEKSKTGH